MLQRQHGVFVDVNFGKLQFAYDVKDHNWDSTESAAELPEGLPQVDVTNLDETVQDLVKGV